MLTRHQDELLEVTMKYRIFSLWVFLGMLLQLSPAFSLEKLKRASDPDRNGQILRVVSAKGNLNKTSYSVLAFCKEEEKFLSGGCYVVTPSSSKIRISQNAKILDSYNRINLKCYFDGNNPGDYVDFEAWVICDPPLQ